MEKRSSIKLITILCLLLLIFSSVFFLKRKIKHGAGLQHDNLQVATAVTETSQKELPSKILREPNVLSIQSHIPQIDDKEFGLPSPITSHEESAVRTALEKLNRPDLKDQPSGPERIRAHLKTLQIPDEELVKLSTEDLVEKVVSSSLFIMMIAYPSPDCGLSSYTQSFNGAREILIRPDAAKVILKEYEQLSNQISERALEKQFTFRFPIMEVLLSSEAVIKQLSDIELREKVVFSIIKSLEARSQYDRSQTEPIYGQATLEYSAFAVAKYLDSLNNSKYQQWFREKSKTGLFSERALTYQESKEVIDMGREYVQSMKQGVNE